MADDLKAGYGRILATIAQNPRGVFTQEIMPDDEFAEIRQSWRTSDFSTVKTKLQDMGARMAADPAMGTPEKAEAKLKQLFDKDAGLIGTVPGKRGSQVLAEELGLDDPLRKGANKVKELKSDGKQLVGLAATIAGIVGIFAAEGLLAKLAMGTLTMIGMGMANGKGISDMVTGLWDGSSSRSASTPALTASAAPDVGTRPHARTHVHP